METLVFYLPQFHSIPENDLWWGKGYTEWTAVRNAKPLFDNHYQPHVPLGGEYYNLLDKGTMIRQTKMMKEYGVDGICFYHYYFEKGRRILEKPVENLLSWSDIDIKFCFSWANETWARTWSNIKSSNSWNSLNEEPNHEFMDGVLLRQDYGDYPDWVEHFDYLLPFFKDSRYIKKDDKPLFVIHKADEVGCLPKMMDCWNELAKKNGFAGVMFVGSNSERYGLDGYIRQEANYTDDYKTLKADYSELSRRIIINALLAPDNCYLCGVPGYDDTPRHGLKGKAFVGATPEAFQKQMEALFKISESKNHDYIFINAWNEWGEGMHLEPDEKYGYSFLEALRNAKKNHESSDVEQYYDEIKTDSVDRWLEIQKELSKQKDIIKHLLRMMSIDDLCNKISALFSRNGWKKIALYGKGVVGDQLRSIIDKSGYKVEFIIDRNANNIKSDLPVISPDDSFPEADLIIVTIPIYYVNVYGVLNRKSRNVISIDELMDMF